MPAPAALAAIPLIAAGLTALTSAASVGWNISQQSQINKNRALAYRNAGGRVYWDKRKKRYYKLVSLRSY